MMFRSTGGRTPATTFREAVFAGLAPDGGLYIPESLPKLRQIVASPSVPLSLHAVGEEVLSVLIDEVATEDLRAILQHAWTFPIPLVHLEENLFLLELFHGPTLAFKDVGARFLARTLSHFLQAAGKDVAIAVATSGDTGSAVAHGFFEVPRITVYVLYPSGKISALQEQQVTTLGKNIHALELEGTFDDCQRVVKQALGDAELVAALGLTTANSISLGRLLPQIAYYVWGVVQWERQYRESTHQGAPIIVVPSGNFGNLTAGMYAWEMGTPIARFVAATNVNDVGGVYLRTGSFAPRHAVQTYSNAMDVGDPSNIARLHALCGGDLELLQRTIATARVTDEETLQEIRNTYERTGRIVDPHTAVGLAAARQQPKTVPCIVTATAHPGKFPDVIERALGIRIPLPEQLQESFHRSKSSIRLPADYDAFRRFAMQDR